MWKVWQEEIRRGQPGAWIDTGILVAGIVVISLLLR